MKEAIQKTNGDPTWSSLIFFPLPAQYVYIPFLPSPLAVSQSSSLLWVSGEEEGVAAGWRDRVGCCAFFVAAAMLSTSRLGRQTYKDNETGVCRTGLSCHTYWGKTSVIRFTYYTGGHEQRESDLHWNLNALNAKCSILCISDYIQEITHLEMSCTALCAHV